MVRSEKLEISGFIGSLVEKIRPLINDIDDTRRRIPLAEVAKLLGIKTRTLRDYVKDGTVPGARQFGRWKEWAFDRDQLEAWWQKFNKGH